MKNKQTKKIHSGLWIKSSSDARILANICTNIAADMTCTIQSITVQR